jgi:hypothetical protein
MSMVHDKDLPVQMKERQKIAHQIAKEACEQTWKIAALASDKISKQLSGNEALSYTGTILTDFMGRWIIQMDHIRQKDGAGIATEDMVKELLNGILSSIGCTASFEEEAPLPSGIKRLKKENDNE